MAFPLPSHLPRKVDVSSQILSKLDSVTYQSLDSSVASSWLAELDESISLTKKRLHDRIHADLLTFEVQLSSAKSAQERLRVLSDDVDALKAAVSDPKAGLTPVLLEALRAHQTLAQTSLNADVMHASLLHLAECKSQLDTVESLVDSGEYASAVPSFDHLSQSLAAAPGPLKDSTVMTDMKEKLSVVINRVEELLSIAYSQNVVVSSAEICVRTPVFVPKSCIPILLAALLSSMSPSALSTHLTTFRRDLRAHYIDYILEHPTSLFVTTENEVSNCSVHRLQRLPSPSPESHGALFSKLAHVFDFLSENLFPSIPQSQKDSFLRSLVKPLSTSIMSRLLLPSLPSKLDALPHFLELTREAVEFETKYVVGLLRGDPFEREIKSWIDNVCAHYERGRRLHILDGARTTILAKVGTKETFVAELVTVPERVHSPTVDTTRSSDDAWNLGDDKSFMTGSSKSIVEESGWDFDEDEAPEEALPTPAAVPKPEPAPDVDVDPSDAWGWNDDERLDDTADSVSDQQQERPTETPEEDGAWDDPWSDEAASDEMVPHDSPGMPRHADASQQEQRTNGYRTSQSQAPHQQSEDHHTGKEPYPVSTLTKDITRAVEDALHEGKTLASSGIFSSSASTSLPGTLIMMSGGLVLDLYRALFPVVASSQLSRPAEHMQFSNDCFYLSQEVDRLLGHQYAITTIKDKLEECKDDLKILADSWFYAGIDKQLAAFTDLLASADGFTDTSNQERYDECEMVITRVLRDTRSVANAWKLVLPKSKYYFAIGKVVDGVLSSMLGDILAIPDIPEVESHKLSELCRILFSLEGLFVEKMDESSFVVSYVPSWLKFSYLSELLEASMADLTYLFEEGALVDFEIDEIGSLVRALFADTPLRTRTLDRIMGGHPTQR
ncbi:hypothetical protein F5I97DRAFT_1923327 [Phlebopus sp. FC_14]|nr:hypothetical protein F5I97DRAFT_1923327 [Phlebopus sp. FC_14]